MPIKKNIPPPLRERPSVTFKLPMALLRKTDALAQREERPRSKIVEMALRQYVEQKMQGA